MSESIKNLRIRLYLLRGGFVASIITAVVIGTQAIKTYTVLEDRAQLGYVIDELSASYVLWIMGFCFIAGCILTACIFAIPLCFKQGTKLEEKINNLERTTAETR